MYNLHAWQECVWSSGGHYDLSVWRAWPRCLSLFMLWYHKWTASILAVERKKPHFGKHGKSQQDNPHVRLTLEAFFLLCTDNDLADWWKVCCHLMNNLHSVLSSINPFCLPFYSLLQSSPTKDFFGSQPTQGTGIMIFSVKKPSVIKSSWKV